jgi:hypothetical protein
VLAAGSAAVSEGAVTRFAAGAEGAGALSLIVFGGSCWGLSLFSELF